MEPAVEVLLERDRDGQARRDQHADMGMRTEQHRVGVDPKHESEASELRQRKHAVEEEAAQASWAGLVRWGDAGSLGVRSLSLSAFSLVCRILSHVL